MSHVVLPKNLERASRLQLLKDRGYMLAQARHFFTSRGLLEVDVPVCCSHACIDENIDLLTVSDLSGRKRYLHSSPEYGMKRLLAEGIGDIFQLSHVFRAGEEGTRHNPEFMMAEWYRCHFSFEEMSAETVAFIELFLSPQKHESISYRAAMRQYAGIDYTQASSEQLRNCLVQHQIELSSIWEESHFDDLLNLIIGHIVEPHLGKNCLTVLYDFPASQCALAEIQSVQNVLVAKRFEVYYAGQELANGYLELRDPIEQKRRLLASNEARLQKNKDTLPIDPLFLEALEQGLPPCCGVAVGFDRLMALRHQVTHINQIIPYTWSNA